jgi:pilus assembly protein Flp/PilA
MLQLAALLEGFKMRLRSDEGATAVEYGLMVSLIAAVIVGVVAALGLKLQTIFSGVTSVI